MHVIVTPSIHSTHSFQANLPRKGYSDSRVGRKEHLKCFVVLDAVEMSACYLTEWKFQAPSFTLVQQACMPSQERVIMSLWSRQKTERKTFFCFLLLQRTGDASWIFPCWMSAQDTCHILTWKRLSELVQSGSLCMAIDLMLTVTGWWRPHTGIFSVLPSKV